MIKIKYDDYDTPKAAAGRARVGGRWVVRAGAVLLEGRSRTGSSKYVTRAPSRAAASVFAAVLVVAVVFVGPRRRRSRCPAKVGNAAPAARTTTRTHTRTTGAARARTPPCAVAATSFPGAPRSDRRRDDVTVQYSLRLRLFIALAECAAAAFSFRVLVRYACVPRLTITSS